MIMIMMKINFNCCRKSIRSVLVFVYKVVDYAVVDLFITYFTETIDYHIMKAAVLTNIQEGLSSGCLIIVAVYIAETRLGHMKVIIFSTISFTLGLGLLYKSIDKHSYPSVMIGILLLAVGKAGLEASLKPFLSYQLKVDEPETNSDESQVSTQKSVWKRVWSWVWSLVIELSPAVVKLEKKHVESLVRSRKTAWKKVWIRAGLLVIMFSPGVVALVLTFFLEWLKILLIATSLMGSACFLFCGGICLYHHRELAGVGSGFSIIFRVIKAFVNRSSGHSTSYDRPINNDNDNDEDKFQLSPKINWLRGFDKVAIIESSTQSQEEQKRFGRICSASQVQLVKRFLSMIPMWTTILVVGLVLSTGDTFFPEQGNNMESSEFLVSVLILKDLSQGMGSNMLMSLIHSKWIAKAKKKTAIQVGIWGGIVSSILCSSVGWQVEHRRATIIRINGLSDIDADDYRTIPMSIFWLSPQFFLLGLTEGLVATGLDEFTVDQFQDPWKEYVSKINEFVIGLGNFLSMLFIQVNKSLFGDTLNNSRLDEYYHRLTIVSFVNMLFYFSVMYIFYGSKRGMIPDAAHLRRLEEGRELISSGPRPPPMGGESTGSNINGWGLIGAVLRFRSSLRRRQGYDEVNDFI